MLVVLSKRGVVSSSPRFLAAAGGGTGTPVCRGRGGLGHRCPPSCRRCQPRHCSLQVVGSNGMKSVWCGTVVFSIPSQSPCKSRTCPSLLKFTCLYFRKTLNSYNKRGFSFIEVKLCGAYERFWRQATLLGWGFMMANNSVMNASEAILRFSRQQCSHEQEELGTDIFCSLPAIHQAVCFTCPGLHICVASQKGRLEGDLNEAVISKGESQYFAH